jgi:hypothetical protein
VVFESGSQFPEISLYGFADCPSLSSISIPASVEVIGDRCFEKCTGLKNVTFECESKLLRIEKRAFADCPSLLSICIPASVQKLGPACFDSCGALRKVIVESGSPPSVVDPSAFVYCLLLVWPTDMQVIWKTRAKEHWHSMKRARFGARGDKDKSESQGEVIDPAKTKRPAAPSAWKRWVCLMGVLIYVVSLVWSVFVILTNGGESGSGHE